MIYDWLTKIIRNGQHMMVLINVQKEHKMEKYAHVQAEVLNHWNSRHDETRSANMNQFDLDIAIRRMVCTVGVDVDFYDEYYCKYEIHNSITQEYEWGLYKHYKSGLQPLR